MVWVSLWYYKITWLTGHWLLTGVLRWLSSELCLLAGLHCQTCGERCTPQLLWVCQHSLSDLVVLTLLILPLEQLQCPVSTKKRALYALKSVLGMQCVRLAASLSSLRLQVGWKLLALEPEHLQIHETWIKNAGMQC